jgi:hypothetical protein
VSSALTGPPREIQPHQHLISFCGRSPRFRGIGKGVDAAKRGLYKGANGGGRNPAAAVL